MKIARILTCLAMLALASNSLAAQTNSNTQVVTLTATVEESLSISIDNASIAWSAGTGNALVPGNATNLGDSAVTVTTTWLLAPGRTAVKLWGYFGSSTAALVRQDPDNTVDIPSAAIQIRCTGTGCATGGTFQPVSGAGPAGFGAANAALELQSTAITAGNLANSAGLAAVLDFNIDLSSGAMQNLPADTYVGSLTIQAQATP